MKETGSARLCIPHCVEACTEAMKSSAETRASFGSFRHFHGTSTCKRFNLNLVQGLNGGSAARHVHHHNLTSSEEFTEVSQLSRKCSKSLNFSPNPPPVASMGFQGDLKVNPSTPFFAIPVYLPPQTPCTQSAVTSYKTYWIYIGARATCRQEQPLVWSSARTLENHDVPTTATTLVPYTACGYLMRNNSRCRSLMENTTCGSDMGNTPCGNP